ncbi:hypothetical protein ACLOJK_033806 [Asimina triloba]
MELPDYSLFCRRTYWIGKLLPLLYVLKMNDCLLFSSMIQNTMAQGKLVPSDITVKVLQKAIQKNGNNTLLIDGFPRNEEARIMFEKITKIEPEFVLFLECSKEETVKRLLNRSEGRDDDNIETIRRRLEVYKESTFRVLGYYNLQGKVRKVDAGKSIEEVYQDVKSIFSQVSHEIRVNPLPSVLT